MTPRWRGAWLALAAGAAAAAPSAAVGANGGCALELIGTWKPATSTAATTTLLSFSDDGWVSLLHGRRDYPPSAFELIGAVEYERDPIRSEHIDFRAHRGIEMFPRGESRWEIGGYGDDGFAARRPASSNETLWSRVVLQRYFLTFASRVAGGAGSAFVMWTQIDGRRTRLEALGAYPLGDDGKSRFGRVPAETARAFAFESDDESDSMLRLELNEATFLRTREMLEAWDALASAGLLSDEDPRLHVMQLIAAVVASANRCATVVELGGLAPDDAERPSLFIRRIRAINKRNHIGDERFPAGWQPPPVG